MSETLSSENAHCRLTLTATTEAAGALLLHCHVTNNSATVLYLCDQLSQLSQLSQPAPATGEPVHELLPDLVHTQVDTLGIHLDKAIMDLSFHDGIQGLDIPFLTRLEPGQEHAQLIRLALPLSPYRVLGLPPGEAAPTLLPLRFTVGYFVDSADVEQQAAPYQGAYRARTSAPHETVHVPRPADNHRWTLPTAISRGECRAPCHPPRRIRGGLDSVGSAAEQRTRRLFKPAVRGRNQPTFSAWPATRYCH